MAPGRVVVLGLEADDSCEEKGKSCGERAVKLRLEWNDNFGMSWNFRVLDDFGLDGTWTCGTQFVWFFVSCHEFCMSFHFCCMTCLWVLCAETTVICFAVLWRVVHADSWIWIEFAVYHKFALFLFWSETLEFGRSHITCQDVWHASWGSIACDLCRKCNSSVKVWVTHLRMNKREFVLGMAWNGWDVVCMVMRGIVKLNCRLCPSCIWVPAYPSGCIRPCLGDSSNSWQRTCQLQQPRQFQWQRESFPCLRIHRWRHRQEWLRRIPRKRKSRILSMWMEKIRKKEMLEEMMTDRDLRGWEGIVSPLTPMTRLTCWVLPQAWLWESHLWSLRWKGPQTNLRSWLRVPTLCSLTFADPWKPLEKPSPTWHVLPNPLRRGWITTPAGLEQW